MENFIKVYPNALSDEQCDEIVGNWDAMRNPTICHPLFDNNNVQLRTSTDIPLDMHHVDDTDEIKELKNNYRDTLVPIIHHWTFAYMQQLGILTPFPLEFKGVKLQKYKAEESGGYHTFHYEQVGSQHIDILRRMLVWMIYLNDVPEGEGETEFLFQQLRQRPKKGDMLIFPAGFTHTHRGNPVYTTDKYIATGWQLWPTQENAQAFMDNQRNPNQLESKIPYAGVGYTHSDSPQKEDIT